LPLCPIERLLDEEHLDAFAATFTEPLGVPSWAGESWAQLFRAHGPDRLPITPYLGFLDDRPVATNMLFCGGGSASVYGVGTVPDARAGDAPTQRTKAGVGAIRMRCATIPEWAEPFD
jgi:hypothetical protein